MTITKAVATVNTNSAWMLKLSLSKLQDYVIFNMALKLTNMYICY
jgi:hypothetical protein